MKAISIKQPFAWLVVKGIKDIENRTWKANYRGTLIIHASKAWSQGGYEHIRDNMGLKVGIPCKKDYAFGALIGMVNMVDCKTRHPSKWFVGPYGFVFKSAEAWEDPMPYRGQLGLFEVPDEEVGEFIYCKK